MLNNTKSRYVVYHYETYIGEGTKEELEELTGLTGKYIDELSYPSKSLKKWKVEKILSRNDYFVNHDGVDHSMINELVATHEYALAELSERLGVCIQTVSHKLNKKLRFKYSEIEELEDLFYLDPGELLKRREEQLM